MILPWSASGLVESSKQLSDIAGKSTTLAAQVTSKSQGISRSVSVLQTHSQEVANNVALASEAAKLSDTETNRSVLALDETIVKIQTQADEINKSVVVIQGVA